MGSGAVAVAGRAPPARRPLGHRTPPSGVRSNSRGSFFSALNYGIPYWFYNILYVGKVTTFLTLLLPRNGSEPETSLSRLTRNLARWHPSLTGPSRSAHRSATLVGYSSGAKPSFSPRRGLTKSMLRTIVQPLGMVTPCPDRFHTRCER